MGDITSVRAGIAPVLSRIKPSELKGPDMAELVGKLAELARSDFDALTRAMRFSSSKRSRPRGR